MTSPMTPKEMNTAAREYGRYGKTVRTGTNAKERNTIAYLGINGIEIPTPWRVVNFRIPRPNDYWLSATGKICKGEQQEGRRPCPIILHIHDVSPLEGVPVVLKSSSGLRVTFGRPLEKEVPPKARVLDCKFEYGDDMDAAVIPLCNAMNSLPGIITCASCSGHGKDTLCIFFGTYAPFAEEGVFFLARCISPRYWKHGNDWTLHIPDVGDMVRHPRRWPTTYVLESKLKGRKAYAQARDLVRNMEHHLNHEAFIAGFGIDCTHFSHNGKIVGREVLA